MPNNGKIRLKMRASGFSTFLAHHDQKWSALWQTSSVLDTPWQVSKGNQHGIPVQSDGVPAAWAEIRQHSVRVAWLTFQEVSAAQLSIREKNLHMDPQPASLLAPGSLFPTQKLALSSENSGCVVTLLCIIPYSPSLSPLHLSLPLPITSLSCLKQSWS